MNVSSGCQRNVTRIYNDQLAASLYSLTNLHADNRVCFFRIGTYQHNDIRFLCDIRNRVCHGTRTKCHSKTGYCCGMTYAGTVICIVGSEAGSDHFLNHINILIWRTGTCKSSQRIRAVLLLDFHKLRSYKIQCLVPCSTLKFTRLFVFDQRVFDTFW